jgi:hypothetical protein
MDPHRLLRLVLLRGCRVVAWSRHHVLVASDVGRTVIPLVAQPTPPAFPERVAQELDVDLRRPPSGSWP